MADTGPYFVEVNGEQVETEEPYEIVREEGVVIYIKWTDIRIVEEAEAVYAATGEELVKYVNRWIATFEGTTHREGVELQPGPTITFSRTGRTAQEAGLNIVKAAALQKWDVR